MRPPLERWQKQLPNLSGKCESSRSGYSLGGPEAKASIKTEQSRSSEQRIVWWTCGLMKKSGGLNVVGHDEGGWILGTSIGDIRVTSTGDYRPAVDLVV
jgi:hypothetical protein